MFYLHRERVLDKEFPRDPSLPFTHLRRFVKWEFLPVRVREQIQIPIPIPNQNEAEAEAENEKRGDGSGSAVEEGLSVCRDDDEEAERGELSHEQSSRSARQAREERQGTIYVLIPPPVPDDLNQLKTLLAPFAPGVVSSSPEEKAQGQEQAQEQPIDVPFYNVTIPLQPPLTSQQAESWSKTYWPTIFNAAASRGMVAPPPKVLETTQSSLEPRAGYYLALAGRVAREAKLGGRGRGVGVVVVDPALAASSTSSFSSSSDSRNISGEDDAVVAVAGDARYCARGTSLVSRLDHKDTDREEETTQESDRGGGPEFHAMMRAIEMVATRRRDDKLASTTTQTQTQTQTSSTIHGTTLSSLETYYLCRPASSSQYPTASTPADPDAATGPDGNNASSRILPRSAGGYLCTDLDVYITHEPCLACSMGMLLSRFRTITFPRRGRLGTGGLASSQDSRERCSSSIDARNRSDGNDHTGDKLQIIDISEDGTRVDSTRVQRETYYGLHWRKELNWRAMCFELIEDGNQGYYDGQDGIEAVGEYHA